MDRVTGPVGQPSERLGHSPRVSSDQVVVVVAGVDPSDAVGSDHLPDRCEESGGLLELVLEVVVELVGVD
mgnify:CR=1 FL=1